MRCRRFSISHRLHVFVLLVLMERAHQIGGGLDRLRELDRKTLIAFYFEGHSLKECPTSSTAQSARSSDDCTQLVTD